MRPALQEIEDIDRYLHHTMSPQEKAVFEARLIIAPGLHQQLHAQQKTYRLVRWFGRRQQRKKLEAIYAGLMQDPVFQAQLSSIFS